MAGIEYKSAWVVTQGWGERDPVYLFESEETARAYIGMNNVPQGAAMRLEVFLAKRSKDMKRDLINTLDRAWTEARNSVTWTETQM